VSCITELKPQVREVPTYLQLLDRFHHNLCSVGATAKNILTDLLFELLIHLIVGPSDATCIAATLSFHGELIDYIQDFGGGTVCIMPAVFEQATIESVALCGRRCDNKFHPAEKCRVFVINAKCNPHSFL
jgi:hypothetical protein